MRFIFLLLSAVVLLAGCETDKPSSKLQVNRIGNPTAQEVLSNNPEANILMHSEVVFISGIQWVEEEDLTKDEYVTEITMQTNDGERFINGAANKLPLGTKIYRVRERGDIVIAETEEGDVRYYKLVEG